MKLSGDSDLAAALEQDYKASSFRKAKRVVMRKTLQKMREASKRERVPPLFFAFIYADLGEKEQAFEWLEKAYEEHSCAFSSSRRRYCVYLRRLALGPEVCRLATPHRIAAAVVT